MLVRLFNKLLHLVAFYSNGSGPHGKRLSNGTRGTVYFVVVVVVFRLLLRRVLNEST